MANDCPMIIAEFVLLPSVWYPFAIPLGSHPFAIRFGFSSIYVELFLPNRLSTLSVSLVLFVTLYARTCTVLVTLFNMCRKGCVRVCVRECVSIIFEVKI